MASMKRNLAQGETIPLQTDSGVLPTYSGPVDYAVALHVIERKVKAALEEMEALRYAILAQDSGPENLFVDLASNGHQFITVKELAEILKVDPRTVYSLPKQGLPAHKIGKELRFDPLEVAAWLKKRQQR